MPFLLRAYLGEADVGRGSGVVNADSERVLNPRRSSRCTPILQQHLLSSVTRQASISACCVPRPALFWHALHSLLQPAVAFHWPSECLFRYL